MCEQWRPLTILCLAIGEYRKQWDWCIESQRRYASRTNADYLLVDSSSPNLHPKWQKLQHALRLVSEGQSVLILDADVFVTSRAPPIWESKDSEGAAELYLANGHSGRPNSGVILLRRGHTAVSFLKELLSRRTENVRLESFVTSEGENGHVIELLQESGFSDLHQIVPTSWNETLPSRVRGASFIHFTGPMRNTRFAKGLRFASLESLAIQAIFVESIIHHFIIRISRRRRGVARLFRELIRG